MQEYEMDAVATTLVEMMALGAGNDEKKMQLDASARRAASTSFCSTCRLTRERSRVPNCRQLEQCLQHVLGERRRAQPRCERDLAASCSASRMSHSPVSGPGC